MKIFYIIPIVAVTLSFIIVGCDILNTKLDTDRTDEMISQDRSTLISFGYKAYSHVENGFTTLDNNLFAAAADEAEQVAAFSDAQIFNDGSWNAFNNPADEYENLFEGVRDANFYLEWSEDYEEFLAANRDTLSDPSAYHRDVQDVGWLRAEVRVLRAYYYFELSKRYGGVPLIQKALEIGDEMHAPRSSFNDIIEFIVSEIEFAMDDLIVDWSEFDIGRAGRITQSVAKALYFMLPVLGITRIMIQINGKQLLRRPKMLSL